jgi:hypothetical protein
MKNRRTIDSVPATYGMRLRFRIWFAATVMAAYMDKMSAHDSSAPACPAHSPASL